MQCKDCLALERKGERKKKVVVGGAMLDNKVAIVAKEKERLSLRL